MSSYPKIYGMGHSALNELCLDDVLVEEKVDGSQFSFGKLNGQMWCRSKGKDQHEATDKMFKCAVQTVTELLPHLEEGWSYRGEYLQSPKHNVLKYNRVPNNHIIIYDIETGDQCFLDRVSKEVEAARIGLEVVPVYYEGRLFSVDGLKVFLDKESCLGGPKIEGVVVKNYKRFGPDKKVLLGKLVSEAFKEVHRKEWKEANPRSGDIIERLSHNYTSQARWQKAVQFLQENGTYTGTPKDIGALVRRVQEDCLAECAQEIMEQLLAWAWPQLERAVIKGLPVWFKDQLAQQQKFASESDE
jgi:hypothetical protein